MKGVLLFLLLVFPNFLFAQKADTNFSIIIHSVNPLTFEIACFSISKKNDEVNFKYSLSDSAKHVDSLSFNLNVYQHYCKLLDSVYIGGDFKDKGPMTLDGISYTIKVTSQTVNREFQTTSPDDNTNPVLYHLIRDTFIIYHKLSKNPLVYHKPIHHKT